MTILNTLIEISIYAIIIFIVLVLFKRICKNKLSPAFHFGLWALLILRLMLPFTVESGFRYAILCQLLTIAITERVVIRRPLTID